MIHNRNNKQGQNSQILRRLINPLLKESKNSHFYKKFLAAYKIKINRKIKLKLAYSKIVKKAINNK